MIKAMVAYLRAVRREHYIKFKKYVDEGDNMNIALANRSLGSWEVITEVLKFLENINEQER